MQMGRASTKTIGNLIPLNSKAKTKEKRMLRIVVSTLFPQDQNALVVKVLVT